MKTALAVFAIAGVALCRGPSDMFGGRGAGGRGGSEERGGRRGPGGQGSFEERGGQGLRPPHRIPPPPPYLRNVTSEARREYFEIARNMSLTIAEQKQEILEWGKKYNVEDQVEEFNSDIARVKEEIRQNVTDLISELDEANKKLTALLDNEDQTPIELFQAIRNLTEENPPVYAVLKFASDLVMKKPDGPHPRGGNPGEAPSPFGSSEEHRQRKGPRDDDDEQKFGGFNQNGGSGIGRRVFIESEQYGRGPRGNNFRL
ncbi:hypothetical protein OESDEN_25210 [Oesophagostomum dentatum]|uniref:SXP/RAL-2 family protein Ani s 5-like cation-binding domain-containing protein n=1 Tax=Oesophagostomum dentatum TaxID=61180 RepID=A0A0B1RRC3_OESDE|nr:hypothetical protein OESDEN_25210 [Oesophagostomum dentatum]